MYSNYARAAAGARAYTSSVYIDRGRPEVNYGGANLLDASGRTIWHSSFTDLEPSATVDLGRDVYLTSVVAQSRQDCCPGRAIGGLLQVLDSRRMVVWSQVMTGNNLKVTGRAYGCMTGQVDEYAGNWNFKLPMECVSRSPTVSPTASSSASSSPSPSASASASVSPSLSPSASASEVMPGLMQVSRIDPTQLGLATAIGPTEPVASSLDCSRKLSAMKADGWVVAEFHTPLSTCTLYKFVTVPANVVIADNDYELYYLLL